MQKLYEPTIRELLQKEVDSLPFHGCKVGIFDKDNPNFDMPNTLGCFGMEDDYTPSVQFYIPRIQEEWDKNKSNILERYSSIEKWIQWIVRHEYRHFMQYEYFKCAGMDWDEVIKIEESFEYSKGPLEQDATDFANNVAHSLDELYYKFKPQGEVYQPYKKRG